MTFRPQDRVRCTRPFAKLPGWPVLGAPYVVEQVHGAFLVLEDLPAPSPWGGWPSCCFTLSEVVEQANQHPDRLSEPFVITEDL